MEQPANLDQAVQILWDKIGEDQRMLVKDMSAREFFGVINHILGMSIRNTWELWYNEKPLCRWFTNIGITNGDDRGAIVLSALHSRLTSKEFDLKGHIVRCHEHWKSMGIKDGIPQIREHSPNGH